MNLILTFVSSYCFACGHGIHSHSYDVNMKLVLRLHSKLSDVCIDLGLHDNAFDVVGRH